MILKINSGGDWGYYDEIESCTVDAASMTLKTAREAQLDGLYLGKTEHFDDGAGKWDAAKVTVRCVTILTRGDALRIGFDGEAFLCNDKGHTLQRIVVGPLASVPGRGTKVKVTVDMSGAISSAQASEALRDQAAELLDSAKRRP